MTSDLLDELKQVITGDVLTDEETLALYSHDASIFSVRPEVVVCPKDSKDVQNLVKFVAKHKKDNPTLSLTARAASTCMSGGGVNDSIIVAFQKYFNHPPTIDGESQTATVEPGVFYRDFEKDTLKHNLIFPAYPSSREICAMGGIVNNNAGGEKSLKYGKAEKYVVGLNMILSDGNEHKIKPLNEAELNEKMKQQDFEGQIYRDTFKLVTENYDLLQQTKPIVSKNSAGYYLWNVYDREKKIFDLNKLFVGAQGTLGLMTQADIKLVPVKKHSEMLIIYVRDLSHLAEMVNLILPFDPESLESYDNITLELALKYFSGFGKKMGSKTPIETFFHFLPEFRMKYFGGLPKLTILVEFTGDHYKEMSEKITALKEKLKEFNVKMKTAPTEKAEIKYWLIRRDSFNLLRSHFKDMYASPFIDDFVVKPEFLPEFLPKFNEIMKKYPSILETFAGHVGNGNFHVIPLVKLTDPREQHLIPEICEEVFKLVMEYRGSTSGEHNDGLIRTPYLHLQYDEKIIKLFEKTKDIFDPEGIFNPRKKVRGDLDFAMKHIRTSW